MRRALLIAIVVAGCGHRHGLGAPVDASGGQDAGASADASPGADDGGAGGDGGARSDAGHDGAGGGDAGGLDGGVGPGDGGGGGPCAQSVCGQALGGGTKGAALGVAVDADRNVYIVGLAESDLVFGGHTLYQIGARDAFIVSFAADGTYRWAKRFGNGTTLAGAYAVAVDAARNIYITGGQTGAIDFGGGPVGGSGMFVASFDHDGNYRWARGDGGLGALALAMAGTHVYTMEQFTGTLAFPDGPTLTSAGAQDVAVAAFDAATGHLAWARRLGGAATDSEGNIVARADSIAFTIAGASSEDGGQLVSWTADGADRWTTQLAPALDVAGLTIDGTGNLYLSGMHDGGTDVVPGATYSSGDNRYVHAFDGAGASRWSWTLVEDPAYQWTAIPYTRATLDAAGNIVLAGTLETTIDTGSTPVSGGSETIFLASYASTGTPVAARSIDDQSSSAHEWLQGIAVDAANVTWPVGQYWGTPNFGDGALPFSSEGGILILRVAP